MNVSNRHFKHSWNEAEDPTKQNLHPSRGLSKIQLKFLLTAKSNVKLALPI